jgi:hypothetical protein
MLTDGQIDLKKLVDTFYNFTKAPTGGRFSLLCGAGNVRKIWSACGQKKIQQKE